MRLLFYRDRLFENRWLLLRAVELAGDFNRFDPMWHKRWIFIS